MGAFVKTTRLCAVAALGLGLSLGVAVSADPSAAFAAVSASSAADLVQLTSSTEIDADKSFDITGTARANSTINIFGLADGFQVSVPVDADGKFQYRTTRGLGAGVRSVQFFVGLESTTIDYRVRGTDGTVPILTPLQVDAPSYVPGQKLTLTGSGTPGAKVDVRAYSAGITGSTVTVGADGKWSFTSPGAVTGLKHDVTVYQNTAIGSDSVKLTVAGDASAFAPLQVDAPSYVPGQKLTVTGSGTPGAKIDVRAYSAGITGSTVTVGADGKWSFTSGQVVTGLSHEVKVYQVNGLGTESKTITVRARDENGEEPTFRALERTSAATYLPGGTTRLTGKATSWSEIRVSLSNPGGKPLPGGSRQDFRVLAGADGTWSIDIPDHKLTKATVKQYSELGNDSIEFEFTTA